jgi:hypothetical protein
MTIDETGAREIAPGITVDPAVRFGRPVIKGTRVLRYAAERIASEEVRAAR